MSIEIAHAAHRPSIAPQKFWPWARRRILFYLAGGACGAAAAVIYAVFLASHNPHQDLITLPPKNDLLTPAPKPSQSKDALVATGVPVVDKDHVIVGSVEHVTVAPNGQPREVVISLAGQMRARIQVAFASVSWNADRTSGMLPFTLDEIRAGFAMVDAAANAAKPHVERGSVTVSYEVTPGHFITISRPSNGTEVYRPPVRVKP